MPLSISSNTSSSRKEPLRFAPLFTSSSCSTGALALAHTNLLLLSGPCRWFKVEELTGIGLATRFVAPTTLVVRETVNFLFHTHAHFALIIA